MEPRTLSLTGATRTPLLGAATSWVRDQLAAPARTGRVLHVGRDATYVEVDGGCLGVMSGAATQVPCAVHTTLTALTGLPGLGTSRVGDPVTVGEGRMSFAGTEVAVGRLVDASTPSISPTPETVAALSASMPWAIVTDELPGVALTALRHGDPAAVADLLGRGGGLTPLGDDVLCGWIATAGAVDRDERASVANEVARRSSRTTTLSATLLACATRGDVLPQFRRLLLALRAGDDPGSALAELLRVGHTSGVGLAAGCLLALTSDGSTADALPANEGNL